MIKELLEKILDKAFDTKEADFKKRLGKQLLEELQLQTVSKESVKELCGFRAGDLVQEPEGFKQWSPVKRIAQGYGGWWYVYILGGGWLPEDIVRKPVEVGDTVRVLGYSFRGRVKSIQRNEIGDARVWLFESDGEKSWPLKDCIAVAPEAS
jgi:hypothetical protein